MTGEGMYCYADGSKYQGEYVNNRRNGYGELKLSNGIVYKWNWVDGQPVSGVVLSANGKTKNL